MTQEAERLLRDLVRHHNAATKTIARLRSALGARGDLSLTVFMHRKKSGKVSLP